MVARNHSRLDRVVACVCVAAAVWAAGAMRASAAEQQPAGPADSASIGPVPAELRAAPPQGAAPPVPLWPNDSGFGPEALSQTICECVLNAPETLVAHGSPGTEHWSGADFGRNGDFTFLYAIGYTTNKFATLDIETGAVTEIGTATPYGSEGWTGLAMDPTTGTMYACSTDISVSSLYTINLSTGAATRIGAVTNCPAVIDIAVRNDGQIYGLDIVNDNLLSINKSTGAGTVLGAIGFDANFSQGMDFDASCNVLYLAAWNADTWQAELRTADIGTGATSLVGVLGSTSPGGLVELTDLAIARKMYVVDSGTAWVDHNWTSVPLTGAFTDPIVVVGPPTSYGWSPGVIRVRNVTPTSFQMKFQEWDYLDGYHCPELVHWAAFDRGIYHLAASGYTLIAQKFSTSKTNVLSPKWVAFPESFTGTPMVLAQVMTYNGSEAVTDRICSVYPGGMHFSMQEQESKSDGHCNEQIGYVAASLDFGDVGVTPTAVTHKPYMLVGMGQHTVLYLREEQSKDAETVHWVPEQVGYIAAGSQPPFIADIQTCHGADPCSLRCTLLAPSLSFNTGAVSVNHLWQTVDSGWTFVDPVVLAGPATYNGADPGEVRVRSVTPTSFQIKFQEWDYLDGWHGLEQIRWFVFERGAWDIGGGFIWMFNEFPMSNANVFSPSWVRLPLALTTADVVLATQQTANGASCVTERISNISPGGFNVALQEEEAADAIHAEETLGYFVAGTGTGGVPISTAAAGMRLSCSRVSTTRDGGPAPRAHWETYIVEEQSKDAETYHCSEIIGQLWTSPVPPGEVDFVADMQTCDGTDPCTLRCSYLSAPGSERATAGVQALGQAASAPCVLSVSARAEGGASLEAAEIGVNGSAAGGLPLMRSCTPRETVTLTAPASITDGADALAFSHWEVDGVPAELGLRTIEVEMIASREAVAVYGPLP